MAQNTSATIRAVEGDRIDLICWKHYGSLSLRVVEQVPDANPGLSLFEVLPAGRDIVLPELDTAPKERTLW